MEQHKDIRIISFRLEGADETIEKLEKIVYLLEKIHMFAEDESVSKLMDSISSDAV